MSVCILVVDDEPDVEALILQKFRRRIRDGAISFLFARDGVGALAALKANSEIDLVVTDINMPQMDGLSLLQKLQENEQHVLLNLGF
jgi:adenylate cyclase